ncbi:putative glycosyltransferase [Phycisphaera mikurensis NBRC 102666]|uniref:Putative glycosyltransferase n=1 Tax=Phycisphaera mikurensis (strain NBRC 102666 / KCTC 22515 / FYK2301M01) TaxID=1142394 RepID=I0IIV5_PHYMF|nr:glycosyltransferase involved in cell wall biosynthesis [Phycisphaera mikurensis]BAM05193.1 putative glycosyltransferase [Phycisphaera mikurensis NBRC 102666]
MVAQSPLRGRDLRPSFVQRVLGAPGLLGRHRATLPLWPLAVEQHDLRGYDAVVSSHHAAAHGVLTRADQTHVSYTHSPARYAWDLYPEHVPPRRPAPLKRWTLSRFRRWDHAAAQRVDHFIANSRTVARRIAKAYRRGSTVIHPPVRPLHGGPPRPAGGREGYVVLGRLVPYKNTMAVVEAFRRSHRRLTVIGEGPELARLRAAADPSTRFITDASDDAAAALVGGCRALIFAAEEDFGLVPVEALAAGTPVVALRRGGATESLEEGRSGVFFEEATPGRVAAALDRFEREGVSLDPAGLVAAADRFAPERFRAAVRGFVEDARAEDLAHGPPAWEPRR